jgi:hypothetical protein
MAEEENWKAAGKRRYRNLGNRAAGALTLAGRSASVSMHSTRVLVR